jgi:large subunit ribosomal protein L20
MPRAKRGTKGRQRHKKLLKLAKGNVGGRRKGYRQARSTVEKGLTYAYRDRKVRKREFRGLVDRAHQRGGADARRDLQPLMAGLKKAGVDLDRKVLADLAVRDPAAFGDLARSPSPDGARPALRAARSSGRRLRGRRP